MGCVAAAVAKRVFRHSGLKATSPAPSDFSRSMDREPTRVHLSCASAARKLVALRDARCGLILCSAREVRARTCEEDGIRQSEFGLLGMDHWTKRNSRWIRESVCVQGTARLL
jgi:hypothetical protein